MSAGTKMVALTTLLALGSTAVFGQAEYPGALWAPANSGNYTAANRPTSHPILYVIIHVAQGSYGGTISWFQNPASNVSAHYVLRSSDGQVTQMLQHKNYGWHAGNSTYNQRSIGIEHEGFVADPAWFTPSMYRSSADLVRWTTRRHNIARDRNAIIGHVEVPGATHTDPGTNWNWTNYMEQIQTEATFQSSSYLPTMQAGTTQQVTVRFSNTGDLPFANSGAGQVTLQTQSPAGRISPFYVAGNWATSSNLGPATFTTSPGSTMEFRYNFKAPLTPGTYTESFQLYKSSIGYFGPIVTLNFVVSANGTIYDNTDPRVSFKGNWTTAGTAAGRYGVDYRYSHTQLIEDSVAQYLVDGVPGREYDVYAWWSQGTNRSTSAKYKLYGGSGQKPKTVLVNQQANGGQWNYLGTVRMGAYGGLVELSNEAPTGFVVIADAVKVVPRGSQ